MTKFLDMFRSPEGKSYAVTFALVSTLFFLWAFCNGMIDVMDKHFQDLLHLSRSQSAWVQFAHYLGYFLIALPAGWLTEKFGYRKGIIAGLLLVSLGGFWFIPATHIAQFWAFLVGVCLIAMGLTFLETIANPYTTVLGDKQFAATRINLAQSCNGVGWIFGPIVGGMFFYSGKGAEAASQTIYIPYLAVAIFVLIIAAVFMVAPLPELNTEDAYAKQEAATGHQRSIWSHLHFPGAVAAQFFYVAAQAGIFSFFINYIVSDTPSLPDFLKGCWLVGGESGSVTQASGLSFLTEKGATKLLSAAFILFLSGRLVGAMLMRSVKAHKLLGIFALANVAMMVLIFLKLSWISVAALFLSFFFMSIMFPTIFALGIWGLGSRAKIASSFIVMAIMGGAIMPKLMGWFSDEYGNVTGWYGRVMQDGGSDKLMSPGFIVPLFCFVVIALYGFNWSRLSGSTGEDVSLKQGGH
ncbi:MAG: MFS transporter [Chthoniobacterales bacterium]|jgi:FHS family L-fucose permease-like MFS transporter|nr:MFS transporter [Chthoniobacterales bacterium]